VSALGKVSSSIASPILRAAFNTLVFESQLTPRIAIDDPFGPVSPSSLIGKIVRPKITLSGNLGRQVIEPWGPPATWIFPFALVGSVLLLVGIGYAIGKARG
jgi:hypothetical protein